MGHARRVGIDLNDMADENEAGRVTIDIDRLVVEAILRGVKAERDYVDAQVAILGSRIEAADATVTCLRELMFAHLEALRNEVQVLHESSERAINKAEVANEKRFEEVDAWRAQSTERERTQQEQQAALAGTFMPREVAEAQMNELRRAIADLTAKLSKIV